MVRGEAGVRRRGVTGNADVPGPSAGNAVPLRRSSRRRRRRPQERNADNVLALVSVRKAGEGGVIPSSSAGAASASARGDTVVGLEEETAAVDVATQEDVAAVPDGARDDGGIDDAIRLQSPSECAAEPSGAGGEGPGRDGDEGTVDGAEAAELGDRSSTSSPSSSSPDEDALWFSRFRFMDGLGSVMETLAGRGWGTGPGGEERRKMTERMVTNVGALLVFGGIVFTFFVTADGDRWRGWTIWEILLRLPVANWERYAQSVVVRPLITKSVISGFVYALGDLIAQKVEGSSISELDMRRVARSGVLGLAFQAPIYHYYYELTEMALPTEGGVGNAIAKVCLDQTVAIALWNALYFLIIGAMTSKPLDETTELIKKSAWPLLVNGWKLWPAAHVVTYTVIPVEHRLLWVDFVEIIWVVILSFTGSQLSKDAEEEGPSIEDVGVACEVTATLLEQQESEVKFIEEDELML